MAQAKSSVRSVQSAATPAAARRSAAKDSAGASDVTSEPTTTGDLAKVIEELKRRIAKVENKQDPGANLKRKRLASDDASSDSPDTPVDATPIQARLRDLCQLEQALHLEEVTIHTRAKAAAQEEFFLIQESQTLQLKLRSFRSATHHLRQQETELEQNTAAFHRDKQNLDQERQTLEQLRQELDAARAQLEADRASMEEQAKAITAPLAALNDAPKNHSITTRHYASHMVLMRTAALAGLALVAMMGLSFAMAWLSFTPTYRASATVAGLNVDAAALSPATADATAWISDATLSQSMITLEQRGIRLFSTPADMRQTLRDEMHATAAADGVIELTFDSPHRDEGVLVLDAIIRSLTAVRDTGDAQANPVRIIRAAAAGLDPIRDGRFSSAVHYFLMTCVTIALIVAAMRKFRRA